MTTEINIIYSETGSKGRYSANLEGYAEEAELTISKVSDALIIADHTSVPDNLRGMGLAAALVTRLIADAREKGQKIIPLCPFVRGYAEKNREALSDVIRF